MRRITGLLSIMLVIIISAPVHADELQVHWYGFTKTEGTDFLESFVKSNLTFSGVTQCWIKAQGHDSIRLSMTALHPGVGTISCDRTTRPSADAFVEKITQMVFQVQEIEKRRKKEEK